MLKVIVAGVVGFILGAWFAEFVGDRLPLYRQIPLPHSWLRRLPW